MDPFMITICYNNVGTKYNFSQLQVFQYKYFVPPKNSIYKLNNNYKQSQLKKQHGKLGIVIVKSTPVKLNKHNYSNSKVKKKFNN